MNELVYSAMCEAVFYLLTPLILTLIVELIVIWFCFLIKHWHFGKKQLLDVILINVLTNVSLTVIGNGCVYAIGEHAPYSLEGPLYLTLLCFIVFCEIAICLLEAKYYQKCWHMLYKQVLVVSIIANICSVIAGLIGTAVMLFFRFKESWMYLLER